jgi:hypothetical protein
LGIGPSCLSQRSTDDIIDRCVTTLAFLRAAFAAQYVYAFSVDLLSAKTLVVLTYIKTYSGG